MGTKKIDALLDIPKLRPPCGEAEAREQLIEEDHTTADGCLFMVAPANLEHGMTRAAAIGGKPHVEQNAFTDRSSRVARDAPPVVEAPCPILVAIGIL
eukprot:1585820-Prymnesium_polylepis.1